MVPADGFSLWTTTPGEDSSSVGINLKSDTARTAGRGTGPGAEPDPVPRVARTRAAQSRDAR
jgi:hypothetical protein